MHFNNVSFCKGAVPSCCVKWDTQTQRTIQGICTVRLWVGCCVVTVEMSVAETNSQSDHHDDLRHPNMSRHYETRRRLRNGLVEESGSGLVCAQTPARRSRWRLWCRQLTWAKQRFASNFLVFVWTLSRVTRWSLFHHGQISSARWVSMM